MAQESLKTHNQHCDEVLKAGAIFVHIKSTGDAKAIAGETVRVNAPLVDERLASPKFRERLGNFLTQRA